MSIVFGFLKKKITGFIDKLTGKEETGEAPKETPPAPLESTSKVIDEKESVSEQIVESPAQAPKPVKPPKEKKVESVIPSPKEHEKPPEKKEKMPTEEPPRPKEKKERVVSPKKGVAPIEKPNEAIAPKPAPAEEIIVPPSVSVNSEKLPEQPKERKVKVGILGTLKSVITGDVEIKEQDVSEMLGSLELELIESDVALEVAEEIVKELRLRLIGQKIKKGELTQFIKRSIEETLVGIISADTFDLVLRISSLQKPAKVMFIGTNGSGKTTTIAKVAHLLTAHEKTVVLAAADTFRAAAIEQLATHAERLGVKIIKRDYGADPTAVAYDAVSYATAHKLDAVLIDTAGRQETNFNLLNEMKKLRRVIQPDITIFIGESIAGNAIISQISEFKNEIGVDAVILTKLDCDAKGGTVLSISKVTGVPIIYLGTGQKYEELEKFDAQEIVRRILA